MVHRSLALQSQHRLANVEPHPTATVGTLKKRNSLLLQEEAYIIGTPGIALHTELSELHNAKSQEFGKE